MDSATIDLLSQWLKSVSIWDLVIWGSAALLVILFWRKKLWPGMVAFGEGIIHLSEMISSVQGLSDFIDRTDVTLLSQTKTLAGQDKEIESIRHETHTNNGSSIKDAVVRIEKTINEIILPSLIGATVQRNHISDTLRDDIESFRQAEITTTVEVVNTKSA